LNLNPELTRSVIQDLIRNLWWLFAHFWTWTDAQRHPGLDPGSMVIVCPLLNLNWRAASSRTWSGTYG